MNIAQAKEQIKAAMTAYFTKDEFGSYRIPIEKQRPVFMIGPPGIGKKMCIRDSSTRCSRSSWTNGRCSAVFAPRA